MFAQREILYVTSMKRQGEYSLSIRLKLSHPGEMTSMGYIM
jgi:hypothetical protein